MHCALINYSLVLIVFSACGGIRAGSKLPVATHHFPVEVIPVVDVGEAAQPGVEGAVTLASLPTFKEEVVHGNVPSIFPSLIRLIFRNGL